MPESHQAEFSPAQRIRSLHNDRLKWRHRCAKPIPGPEVAETKHVKSFLDENHHCERYTKYRCGFNPKEHMEMTMLEELRARHAAESEKLRLWQEEVREKDKRFAEESKRAEREWQERQTELKRKDDWYRLAASSAIGAAIPILMFIIARYFK